ncbi:hypothetical protein E3U43_011326 [Larimichthys crocea]|uniref:Uncharacterized protein n=1 Tax=Larimichthys crocea TaxID=215358 RepID=A0ACD3QJ94_LARCR|nr:hypothetical protein E3U43_011326 [Larimichthys crocea]
MIKDAVLNFSWLKSRLRKHSPRHGHVYVALTPPPHIKRWYRPLPGNTGDSRKLRNNPSRVAAVGTVSETLDKLNLLDLNGQGSQKYPGMTCTLQ